MYSHIHVHIHFHLTFPTEARMSPEPALITGTFVTNTPIPTVFLMEKLAGFLLDYQWDIPGKQAAAG